MMMQGYLGQTVPSATDSAELYDPATRSFTTTGSMRAPRIAHTGTLLPDGRVLIAGSTGTSAELYDPITGSFTATGGMETMRANHTANGLTEFGGIPVQPRRE